MTTTLQSADRIFSDEAIVETFRHHAEQRINVRRNFAVSEVNGYTEVSLIFEGSVVKAHGRRPGVVDEAMITLPADKWDVAAELAYTCCLPSP